LIKLNLWMTLPDYSLVFFYLILEKTLQHREQVIGEIEKPKHEK